MECSREADEVEIKKARETSERREVSVSPKRRNKKEYGTCIKSPAPEPRKKPRGGMFQPLLQSTKTDKIETNERENIEKT